MTVETTTGSVSKATTGANPLRHKRQSPDGVGNWSDAPLCSVVQPSGHTSGSTASSVVNPISNRRATVLRTAQSKPVNGETQRRLRSLLAAAATTTVAAARILLTAATHRGLSSF